MKGISEDEGVGASGERAGIERVTRGDEKGGRRARVLFGECADVPVPAGRDVTAPRGIGCHFSRDELARIRVTGCRPR